MSVNAATPEERLKTLFTQRHRLRQRFDAVQDALDACEREIEKLEPPPPPGSFVLLLTDQHQEIYWEAFANAPPTLYERTSPAVGNPGGQDPTRWYP